MFFKKSKEEIEEEKKDKDFAEKMEKRCNFFWAKTNFTDIPRNACGLVSGLTVRKRCDGDDCIFMKLLKKGEKNRGDKN